MAAVNQVPIDRTAQAVRERARQVAQGDAIFAQEGFAKDYVTAELDVAYVAGRITLDQRGDVVRLDARLASMRNALKSLPTDDKQRPELAQRLKEQTAELQRMATAIGPELLRALDLS